MLPVGFAGEDVVPAGDVVVVHVDAVCTKRVCGGFDDGVFGHGMKFSVGSICARITQPLAQGKSIFHQVVLHDVMEKCHAVL